LLGGDIVRKLFQAGFAGAVISTGFIPLAGDFSLALAADLARPVYKAAPVVTVYNWTGLYIGGHAGWASGIRNFEQTSLVGGTVIINPGFSHSPNGFIGGGQIGFNQQTGNWVWGLEAEVSGADLRKATTVAVPASLPLITQTYDVAVDWTATLTGRLGYTWDRWLVYGKGGTAVMRETYGLTAPGLVIPDSPYRDAKVTRLGWTVGAGIENAFLDNWSWKAEYNYLRFDGDDSISNTLSAATSFGLMARTDVDIHVVKAGINYRFGGASAAADLRQRPVYKAAPMVMAYNWTGLYIGGHLGWAGADRDFLTTIGPTGNVFNPGFAQKSDGVIGGGQIGFNRQTGNWVLGLEADISGTNLGARTTVVNPLATVSLTYDVRIDWTASLAGRVGYAWDRWMVYGKGGAALMRETYGLVAPPFTPRDDAEVTRFGWTVGAGIENAFRDNWSWKAEYNYMRFDNLIFGNANATSNAVATAAETNLDVHAVKLGVNYKFSN
jgi:outer membrane immunogenic protein